MAGSWQSTPVPRVETTPPRSTSQLPPALLEVRVRCPPRFAPPCRARFAHDSRDRIAARPPLASVGSFNAATSVTRVSTRRRCSSASEQMTSTSMCLHVCAPGDADPGIAGQVNWVDTSPQSPSCPEPEVVLGHRMRDAISPVIEWCPRYRSDSRMACSIESIRKYTAPS
jgi:hypothetical protein